MFAACQTNRKCHCLKVKGSLEGFPVLLVGNKCDEESGKRQVSTKTGEALEVWFQSVCLVTEIIYYIYLENVESQVLGNIRQKGHKYKRAV